MSSEILTVRLTAEEKRILAARSRKAGMKKATFVRQLIREERFDTSADLLAYAEERIARGDARFGVKP